VKNVSQILLGIGNTDSSLYIDLGIDAFNTAEANDLAKIELGKNGKILATRLTSQKLTFNFWKLEPSLWFVLGRPTCTGMTEDIGVIAAFLASCPIRK
jgi:hypothetical protein